MEQLYFTLCPADYGLGKGAGAQIKRRSSGYPASDDTRHYRISPFLPGTKDLAPPVLRYRLEGDEAELIAITPRATEFETEQGPWGKPGGFFTHAIRLEMLELGSLGSWPAGLYEAPIWRANDPEPTRGRGPGPLGRPLTSDLFPRKPTFAAIQPLAEDFSANELASLLASLAQAARLGRTLVLRDPKPERLADRVALLTYALPGTLRSGLTFSTYHDKPEELPGYRIQGTTGPRSRIDALSTLGPVFDLESMVVHDEVETSFWATTLAIWLVLGGPDEHACWEAFAKQVALDEAPNLAREAWSDVRLDKLVRAAKSMARNAMAPKTKSNDPKGTRETPTRAVGIDLGTTYSLVAYLDPQGHPVSVPSSSGDLLTPSVVLFEDDGVVVGKEAVAASVLEPERVAIDVKRDMGARSYHRPINGKELPPEVISSYILRKLKEDAERVVGPLREVVITVPAYFDEPRRRATMDAGRLAGLAVLEIINEPTAAALAFAQRLGLLDASGRIEGDKPLKALVYDLGGGTFDVTVVELKTGSFRAITTDGDVYLGGKDWDQALVDMLAESYLDAKGSDPREDPASLQDLRLAAEAAKRALSERSHTPVVVNHRGVRHKVELTRAEFEERTEGLVERTRATTEIVVRQAKLTWSDIDRVLLVGGSTRMPMIRAMLRELTGKEPDASLPADEAVALGAAIHAGLLLRREGRAEAEGANFEVTNVNAHSLGLVAIDVETGRKVNRVLIPKNTPLPCRVTGKFQTNKAGQKNVKLTVMEGESELPSACTHVGDALIRGLPKDLPAAAPVQVRYTYQPDGTLTIHGSLVGRQASVETEFQRVAELSDEEFSFWVEHMTQTRNRMKK